MPDRHDAKRILEGEVSGTPSSDAVIEKALKRQETEYYALTGKRITARPVGNVPSSEQQVLKPGSFTSEKTTPVNEPITNMSKVVVNFSELPTNPSGVGRNLVKKRQQNKAA